MNANYKIALVGAAALCLVVVLYYTFSGDGEQRKLADAESGPQNGQIESDGVDTSDRDEAPAGAQRC